jgi:hypothetical protein
MVQLLPYLLVLLWPITMGAMMWMMMRPNQSQGTSPADPRIAELESQVSDLRAAWRARDARECESREGGV